MWIAFSMTVTPHHLTFIFNSFNICPFCQTTEKLKEIKAAKGKVAKRLCELYSTKTGSYPHEFLCRTNCSACADYQP
jgi:dihydroorotase